MHNPLNESQRELLSAYLDGEVSDAERHTAEELLKREDAQAYLESLRATVSLVTSNAPVRAPVGLGGRVMNDLKDEFKQSVDPGSEPFTAIPRISWQAPIWAAAAAVVVSVAIMFGPSLFNTKPQGPEIARDVLDNLPSGGDVRDDRSTVGDEKPEGAKFDREKLEGEGLEKFAESERTYGENFKKTVDELDELKAESSSRMNDIEDEVQPDPTESVDGKVARRTGKGAAAAGEESEKDASTRKEMKNQSENADAGEPRGGGRDEDNWHGGGSGGKTAKTKDENEGGMPSAESPERRSRDSAEDKKRSEPKSDTGRDLRELEEVDREDGTATPPSPRASEPPSDNGPGNDMPAKDAPDALAQSEAIVLTLTEGDSLAAQTDVLWISTMYGDAKIADSDNDVESIEIEVDADKLPELMAALRKLAEDQGYGEVEGGKAEEPEPETAEAETEVRRISGYMPTEAEPAAPNEPELKSEVKERVRLVIRMK